MISQILILFGLSKQATLESQNPVVEFSAEQLAKEIINNFHKIFENDGLKETFDDCLANFNIEEDPEFSKSVIAVIQDFQEIRSQLDDSEASNSVIIAQNFILKYIMSFLSYEELDQLFGTKIIQALQSVIKNIERVNSVNHNGVFDRINNIDEFFVLASMIAYNHEEMITKKIEKDLLELQKSLRSKIANNEEIEMMAKSEKDN